MFCRKVDLRTQLVVESPQIRIYILVCEAAVMWGLTVTKYILLKEIQHLNITEFLLSL